MMELEHKELLKKIRIHIENFNEGKISLVKYFKETTYKDVKGERRTAYEVTKRGCGYIAHKMTGVKGAIFTDKYMDKFDKMEQALKQQPKQVDTKEKEIEARLINAKVRQASIYLKIADRVTIPRYKDICYSKATEALNKTINKIAYIFLPFLRTGVCSC